MRGAFADTDRKGFDLELARDGNLDIEALTLEQLQKLYETVDVMAGSVNNEEARENFMMMRAIIGTLIRSRKLSISDPTLSFVRMTRDSVKTIH